jgi:hypothetical protein
VILAGKRTGQTAAWAGISSLLVWFEAMLILHRYGFSSYFVAVETTLIGHGKTRLRQAFNNICPPEMTKLRQFIF